MLVAVADAFARAGSRCYAAISRFGRRGPTVPRFQAMQRGIGRDWRCGAAVRR